MRYAHLASRIFDEPLLVAPDKASAIVTALSERFDVAALDAGDAPEPSSAPGSPLAATEASQARPYLFVPDAGVAVLSIVGTLVHRSGFVRPTSGLTGYDGIRTQLRAALADQDVQGILLDVHSAGGEAHGVFDVADEIAAARAVKPIWAVADEAALSAAYALASAADRLFVPRTGKLGSIGTLVIHADYSGALSHRGVAVTLIASGSRKAEGNPFEPLPEEVRARIQADVDALNELFVATVAANRDVPAQRIRSTEAAVLRADEAVKLELADAVAPAPRVAQAFIEHLANGETPP